MEFCNASFNTLATKDEISRLLFYILSVKDELTRCSLLIKCEDFSIV